MKLFKKQENGRTTLELLAVVALMGILSVVGFLGYQFSLDYLTSTTVSDSFYKAKSLLLAKKIRSNEQLSTFLQQTGVGPYLKSIANDTDGYHIIITLETVPSVVCLRLQDDFDENDFKVVPNENTCLTNEGVRLRLVNEVFLGRYKEESGGIDTDSPTTTPTPDEGEGETDDCAAGLYLGTDGLCYACSDVGDLPISVSDCANCDGREYADGACVVSGCGIGVNSNNPLTGTDGNCYACSNNGYLPVVASECAKCNNREMRDEGCALICPDGQFLSTSGICYLCSVSSNILAAAADCADCEKREMLDTACILTRCGVGQYADLPLTAENGDCFTCTGDLILNTARTHCVECNVASDCDEGICYLNECTICPDAKPYWNSAINDCDTCPTSTPAWNATYQKCEACPTTDPIWNGEECVKCYEKDVAYPLYENGKCVACPSETVWYDNNKECTACYLIDSTAPYYDKTSKTCTICPKTTPAWNDTKFECEACPELTPYWDDTSCTTCYANGITTPYWNKDTHDCEVCPTATPKWNETTSNCEECSGTTPYWSGTDCVDCLEDEDCAEVCLAYQCSSCLNKDENYPYWDGDSCTICPDNASITVNEGNQFADSNCYCNAGYSYDEDTQSCQISQSAYCVYFMTDAEAGNTSSMKKVIGCPDEQYCYIYWSDTECTVANYDSVGNLYGLCIPLAQASISDSDCPTDKTVMCEDNYQWTGDTCVECTENAHCPELCDTSTNTCTTCVVQNGATAPIFDALSGACEPCPTDTPYYYNNTCTLCPDNSSDTVVDGNQINDTSCYCDSGYAWNGEICAKQSDFCVVYMTDAEAGETSSVAEIIGCPTGQYCYVYWSDTECTVATYSDVGTLYGACIPLTQASTTECPAGKEIICPDGKTWYNEKCAECTSSAECTGDNTYCDSATYTCQECAGNTPYLLNDTCVACLIDDNCTNQLCDNDSHTCVDCSIQYANSSATVIEGNQIDNTICYCEDGYDYNAETGTCESAIPDYCVYTMTDAAAGQTSKMEKKIGCPTDYYCYIYWKNITTCTAATYSDVGDLYGLCIPLDQASIDNDDCPYK